MPVYTKLTIPRLTFGRYVPKLRSDGILLAIGLIARPNYGPVAHVENKFVLQEGQNFQHDDSLGPSPSIHHISTLPLPIYDMTWSIDEKFRGDAVSSGGFVSI